VQTYIILSRLSPDALKDPKGFKKLAEQVTEHIKRECPGVFWRESYAAMGRFDIVDLVESDDLKQVERAVMIIRTYGHSLTETMAAFTWKDFLARL
jgi:uncharacterized protein with GYD domain